MPVSSPAMAAAAAYRLEVRFEIAETRSLLTIFLNKRLLMLTRCRSLSRRTSPYLRFEVWTKLLIPICSLANSAIVDNARGGNATA